MPSEPGTKKAFTTRSRIAKFIRKIQKLWKITLRKNSPEELEATVTDIISEHKAEGGNGLSKKEQDILRNFLKFGDKKIEDIMIPRSDICAVREDISAEELSKTLEQKIYTRMPVYKDNLDNIAGFLHIKDMTTALVAKQKIDVTQIMRKVLLLPPSMALPNALVEMNKKRTHMAIIIDEYGGTDGIITIEDIMEALVGQLDDEHDELDDNMCQKVGDKEFAVNARMPIEELEKVLKIKLLDEYTDNNYDTIGGMVTSKFGAVPGKGMSIELNENITAHVLSANPRFLQSLKLVIR